MKLVVCCLILFSGLTVSAQDKMIYKYRAFESLFYDPQSHVNLNSATWNKTNILVTVDLNKQRITVYAAAEQEIDLIGNLPDKTSDDASWIRKVGVDQDGVKCNVEVQFFKNIVDEHICTLYLEYKDFHYLYRLKSND